MRFRLRTLLIVLALGPMVLAGSWFVCRWLTLENYQRHGPSPMFSNGR